MSRPWRRRPTVYIDAVFETSCILLQAEGGSGHGSCYIPGISQDSLERSNTPVKYLRNMSGKQVQNDLEHTLFNL